MTSLAKLNCLLCGTVFLCGRGVATIKCPLCGAQNFPRGKNDGGLERILKSTVNQRNARSARKAVLTGWDATVEKLRMHKMQYYSMSSSTSVQESVKQQCEEMRKARSPSLHFYDLSRQRSFFSASLVLGRPNPRQLKNIAERARQLVLTDPEASEDRLKSSHSTSSLTSKSGTRGTRLYGHTPTYKPFWEHSSDLSTGYLHQTRPPSHRSSTAQGPFPPTPTPQTRMSKTAASPRSKSAPPDIPDLLIRDWHSPANSPQWHMHSYKSESRPVEGASPPKSVWGAGAASSEGKGGGGGAGEEGGGREGELASVRYSNELQRTERSESSPNWWPTPPLKESLSMSGSGMVKAMVETERSSPALLQSQRESSGYGRGSVHNGSGKPVSTSPAVTVSGWGTNSRPSSHKVGTGATRVPEASENDTRSRGGGPGSNTGKGAKAKGPKPPSLGILVVPPRSPADQTRDWRRPLLGRSTKGMRPIKWVTSPKHNTMELPLSPFHQRVQQPQGRTGSPFSTHTHLPSHLSHFDIPPRSPLSPNTKPNSLKVGVTASHTVSFTTAQPLPTSPHRASPTRSDSGAQGRDPAPKTPDGLGVGLVVRGEKSENHVVQYMP